MPDSNAFPLYSVKGNAYEIGWQHGNLASERVFRSVQLYRNELIKRNVSESDFHFAADCMTPLVKSFDPHYFDEIVGIANGSGLQLAEIILINCRTEMLYCGNVAKLTSNSQPVTDGCTGLVVLPSKTENSRLLHAHNWDWLTECGNSSIVLKITKPDGNGLLTFTEAGSLARHGFNNFGLSLSGNFLCSIDDYKSIGNAPLVLLRRKVLEAQSINEALEIISSTTRFCSNNLILAHNGESIAAEMSPSDFYTVKPTNGLLVHANHWLNTEGRMREKHIDGGGLIRSSIGRQKKIEELLANLNTKITWGQVKSTMSDSSNKPHGVLSYPSTSEFGETATVATIIMAPEGRKMWVQRNPYESAHGNRAAPQCFEL